MKKLCGAIMLGLMAPAAAHAAWQCATNVQNYSASCSPTVQQYCCPNGQSETIYSCPTGWTLSGTTCVRNGTTTGSDSTGTYEISYGSCDATQKTVECCTLTTNPSDAKTCLMCVSGMQ